MANPFDNIVTETAANPFDDVAPTVVEVNPFDDIAP